MSLEHCRVVLVQTHYPGNLGSTARVMRNFGLTDLVLVSPIANRHDRNAKQLATHGESILNDARIVTDLSEAINDCVLVVGTSSRTGGAFRQQNVGTPEEVMPLVVETLKGDRPAALVFGPEANGLPNEMVTRCHHLICIPTADESASLNVAQAVAVCLYELRKTWERFLAPERRVEGLATLESQEHMFAQLQTALQEIHFLFGDKADPLMHAIRHLLGKSRLTEMETKLLLGLARQIRWYVENHPKNGPNPID